MAIFRDPKVWAAALLTGIGLVWMVNSTEREHAVLEPRQEPRIQKLEAEAAKAPHDGPTLRALAQGYLDARLPGMAYRALDTAPNSVKLQPETLHLLAGVLLEQGKVHAALDAEVAFQKSCKETQDSACTPFLDALAERRIAILKELVRLGVEDALAEPEKAQMAHHNATRTVTAAEPIAP